jgi:hypothetical protein
MLQIVRAITVLFLMSSSAPAQLSGLWVTKLLNDTLEVDEHWSLRLREDGSYERTRMRNAPVAYRHQVGMYTVSGDSVLLEPEVGLPLGLALFEIHADGDSLIAIAPRIPLMDMVGSGELDWDLVRGRWRFDDIGSQGTEEITFGQLMYETDVKSGLQIGP